MKYSAILLSFLFPLLLAGQQEPSGWLTKLEKYKIKPVVGIQLWSSYTIGEKLYQEESGKYTSVNNRVNTQLRRSRIGIKGQPYENLQFNFIGAFDFVGRDALAGTEGGVNNGSSPQFRLWDAYVQWRIKPGTESLNLVAGYLVPQIGRESISSALRSSSLEKSWSQNYLRRHLTGTGPGRAAGLNMGGLLGADNGKISLGYDIGVFNPLFEALGGNSTGQEYAPLIVGRIAVSIGDPESKSYTLNRRSNLFGQRKGLTLALAGATQGKTDLFTANRAAGADLLFNWGNLNVDGEWTVMMRDGQRLSEDEVRAFTSTSNTGYLRIGYNLPLKNKYTLEPTLMVVQFNGALSDMDQADATAVGALAGRDETIDIGVNLYPNPDLKLSLHYTFRDGNAGAAGPGARINNYFYQSGAGAIQRGSWLGLGLVAIL